MPEPTSNILTTPVNRILLLLTSDTVKSPSLVESITNKFKQNITSNEIHRHVIDRISNGAAKLPSCYFSTVYYLPSSFQEQEDLFATQSVLSSLFEAIEVNGTLQTILLSSDSSQDIPVITPKMITSAIVAGFLQSEDKLSFIKPHQLVESTAAATLLNRRSKKQPEESVENTTINSKKKLPIFKRKQTDISEKGAISSLPHNTDHISSGVVKLTLSDDFDDNDDSMDDGLIDENALLIEAAKTLSKPIVLPPRCDPGPGKRRRKACRDCTCGLRELEIQEEEEHRKNQNAVILNLDGDNKDDDYAIDFTVAVGKPVGSCGSCALGDAFRCDSCPYLGLPPFKPGEIIKISSIKNDL
ncbi:uncharacterized protein SAPINGB_P003847 [Magnusiomyces paraingens]|uniref:Uncharacterized protein n=1 Tax=Magnusiomyces paraingens TaxID=2606893 RepID=A0A5E8BSH6_9ASCO|nr:uncharacterized protein SAPINGB_P003847 [Saprochaete ingens]VVT53981.1 unnamed protein product [Saprochaete ingens]